MGMYSLRQWRHGDPDREESKSRLLRQSHEASQTENEVNQPMETFIKEPRSPRDYEEKFSSMEEEGPDALEMAAQANEEGTTTKTSASNGIVLDDIFSFI